MSNRPVRVGLISDTHGLLRREAVEALRGCDFIVHAGDIGDASILDALARLAPVTAVHGNNDRGAWTTRLPASDVLRIGEVSIHVIHDRNDLDPGAVDGRYRVVVSGHSHRPSIEERDDVLYVNPGSAGPRRFTLPVSLGELLIRGPSVSPRLVVLEVLHRAT